MCKKNKEVSPKWPKVQEKAKKEMLNKRIKWEKCSKIEGKLKVN